jgi:Rieske Fe-S protein
VKLALAKQDGADWLQVTAAGTGDAAVKDAAEITKRTQGWAYKLPEAHTKTLETTLPDMLLGVAPPPAAPAAAAPAPVDKPKKAGK